MKSSRGVYLVERAPGVAEIQAEIHREREPD
ncbi:hypothetical protein Goarm_003702 [Gossypium armourianum]|uniref:Uncharacterized protein n=1 Tax=Gossypium armourianum TaxID=34283 RepID=A0A7J9K409_9ROSI|nr:hypothetical protein [Gossypium armourianum]